MKTIDTVLPVTDPVIQEVRRYKQAIAEEFGFDVVALGRSLQERQARDPRFIMTQGAQGGVGNILELLSHPSTAPTKTRATR